MPEFIVDRRDFDFVLFEQFDLGALAGTGRYADMNAEDFRAVLDGGMTFLREVAAPTFDVADRQGCKLENGRVRTPSVYRDLFKKFAEGGWIAPSRPQELGGMGLPLPLSISLVELGIAAAPSFIFIPGLASAAGHLLEAFASPELRDLIVPRYYRGQWTGTMCLTEAQAGTAIGDITTRATPLSGNEYLIQGNKIFISAGDHDLTENIVHLVLARVPGDPPGTKGISLFAVPKIRFDATGRLLEPNDVHVTAIEEKMGLHGSPTCALSFGDNGNCRGYLIGERSKGIVYMFKMMNEARIVCGLQGSGLANRAYQAALAYARQRIQGAKSTAGEDSKPVAIIEHPDVRRNLMLAKAYAEGIRALLIQAAFHAEAAQHADGAQQAQARDLVDFLTPICKAYASDVGFDVTNLAMQIHGGYGYTREYGVEQMMRDVKIASIYEGANGVQALDLVGRKMRMKGGALFMAWLNQLNIFTEEHREHAALRGAVEAIDKAKNAMAQTAMAFQAQGAQDPEWVLLSATPFLRLCGHIEVARLLAHQGIVAHRKLQALPNRDPRDNAEARFYDGKVKTATFFANHILPEAISLAKSIQGGDRSALDILL